METRPLRLDRRVCRGRPLTVGTPETRGELRPTPRRVQTERHAGDEREEFRQRRDRRERRLAPSPPGYARVLRQPARRARRGGSRPGEMRGVRARHRLRRRVGRSRSRVQRQRRGIPSVHRPRPRQVCQLSRGGERLGPLGGRRRGRPVGVLFAFARRRQIGEARPPEDQARVGTTRASGPSPTSATVSSSPAARISRFACGTSTAAPAPRAITTAAR